MAARKSGRAATKVITGLVRLSYVHLLEPYGDDGQEKKYSCVVMVPKKDQATMSAIRAAQKAAMDEGLAGKFHGRKPRDWDTVRDGDEFDNNPEYAGFWIISSRSKSRPQVVDRDMTVLTTDDEVYSGMWARVSMSAYAYDSNGNRGITFGLNNVQKVKDGDFLGGRSRAEDDFDDDFDGFENDELDEDDYEEAPRRSKPAKRTSRRPEPDEDDEDDDLLGDDEDDEDDYEPFRRVSPKGSKPARRVRR